MAHATALVRSGNLMQATVEIQRALRGDRTPAKQAADPEPRAALWNGRFLNASYTDSAGTRAYKTYLPAHPVEGLPVVVMLHGCKQQPDDFAAGTRMNALADELGFVVVYPAQASQANASCCWNWFQEPHQRRGARRAISDRGHHP